MYNSLSIFLLCLLSLSGLAQNPVIISGFVRNASTGEPLAEANVYIRESLIGTTSHSNGYYSLTIPSGEYNLVISYLGFVSFERNLITVAGESLRIDVELEVKQLAEVEIRADHNRNTESPKMGVDELSIETIKALPAFLGEIDVLKSLQLLPGVQSAGEGNTGFYVRGGGPDQNLILLDDAQIYNASHLFGFFSVFNADAISNVELIKGGMPANYGSRLSSVLTVNQREGNKKEFAGSGGLGLISSRLTLEGPLKKDKASFIVSGRRTYIDVLAKPFLKNNTAFGGTGYFFYDLNAKLNWRMGTRDILSLGVYYGDDVFNYRSEESEFTSDIDWGNRLVSARWNHIFSNKLLLNASGGYTKYNFGFAGSQEDFNLSIRSSIEDYSAKADFSWFPHVNHDIKFGLQYVYHELKPNNTSATQGSTVFDLGVQPRYLANEAAVYILDEFDISDRIRINAGLRYSGFQHMGPFTRYVLDENNTKTDTIKYAKNESIKTYHGPEPRLSLRFKINNRQSIKAAFTQNYQYIHLTSISPMALPTDVWLPSTDVVSPQFGRQYNIGYFRNFKENMYESSVEIYYKDLESLIEYKENTQASDGVDNNEDNFLTYGIGRSYGLELFLKKRKGKFTGWIGYTIAKTERKFEEINNGQWYPAIYDRRHDLSVVTSYSTGKKWDFGATFVFATGNAITLPISRYFIENRLVFEYAERNSFRMRNYHRLDLSATLNVNKDRTITDKISGEEIVKRKFIQSSWTFSVYNAYSRANPYFYYFDNEGNIANNSFKVVAKQVSLFPVLPSVTWNFNF